MINFYNVDILQSLMNHVNIHNDAAITTAVMIAKIIIITIIQDTNLVLFYLFSNIMGFIDSTDVPLSYFSEFMVFWEELEGIH